MSDEVTYGSYLALDELLSLQEPRSQPEHPDELLFIVVHQSSELWFKAILHDIHGLVGAFEARDGGQALWRLQRINALMRIVSSQLSSLETLPPQHFAQFRTYLGSSSGAQSKQFRAIEAASPDSSAATRASSSWRMTLNHSSLAWWTTMNSSSSGCSGCDRGC